MDISYAIPTERFARCIAALKRVRWDIEADVIRDRRLDRASKFLPDGLSLAGRLDFLSSQWLRKELLDSKAEGFKEHLRICARGSQKHFKIG